MAKTGANTSGRSVVIPVESAEQLKAKLQRVSDEIAKVRDKTREDAESLERIRGLLDLKHLNEMLGMIQSLETRVRQVEAAGPVKPVKAELEREQRRLAKLWDAFKTQEDQLKALERERNDILDKFRGLERQLVDMGTPTQIRARISHLDSENRRVGSDLATASTRVEKYVGLFTQEQERLAKLYKVYEDAEARLHRYETEAKAWRAWWEKFGDNVGPGAGASARRIRRAK